MKSKLIGIPETLLIPLWARSTESKQKEPIICDPKSVEIVSCIDYDFFKFKKSWLTQLGVSIRTMLFDNETVAFLKRNPDAVIINLGSGLDTRYERLKNEKIFCWYDLDVPEAIKFRRMFFTEGNNNKFIAKSLFDFSWMKDINHKGKPILIIAEGLLMYFSEQEVKPVFKKIASSFPKAEMLFETLSPFFVGKSKYHETVKRIDSKAEFKWGLKNSQEIELWDKRIQFLEEWNYSDYHKKRWRWFGYIARFWFIKSALASKIVHLRFL